MIRLIPVIVATGLMITFLLINQLLLTNHLIVKESPKVEAESAQSAMAADTDARGTHSYFPQPRIFTNRRVSNAVLTSRNQQMPYAPLEANAYDVEDLLHAGYLPDNHANYDAAFGTARP